MYVYINMTSTRNKNTNGDYYLEQRNHRLAENYYLNSQMIPQKPAIPGKGYGTTTKMMNNELSHNHTDIESSLLGIGSSNLVKSKPNVIPQIKKLPQISFFKEEQTILPNPLVIEKNQRHAFQ